MSENIYDIATRSLSMLDSLKIINRRAMFLGDYSFVTHHPITISFFIHEHSRFDHSVHFTKSRMINQSINHSYVSMSTHLSCCSSEMIIPTNHFTVISLPFPKK